MFLIDIALNIIIIVSLVFIIRTYLIAPFQVYGPSMCDTLNYLNNKCEHGFGEYIIVNKAGYQNFLGWKVGSPKRGDIVVFHPPQNSKEFFIKRVIGLPGETMKLKGGFVYIYNQDNPKGLKLAESYLNSANQGNTQPYKGESSEFRVPDNQYFVLGDNRIASSDSRSCFKENLSINKKCTDPGFSWFIKPNSIEGKAWIILWPVTKAAILPDPAYKTQ